jgi:hypothetical protein
MKYLLMVKNHQENQNRIAEGGQHAPEFHRTDPQGSACSGKMDPIASEKAILNQNSTIFLS